MENNEIKRTVVLDLGSGYTKAGFAEDDNPTCTIPTAIFCDESSDKGFYIGNSVLDAENATYPIEHGIIQNYEQIEKLLEHVFSKELSIKCEEHPVLLAQPPKNPQRDKEKLAELIFEKFNCPALYEEMHSVLAFNSAGRSSGLMVESGHGVTTVVPILSGFVISEAILRLDVGGGDVDRYLSNLINSRSCLENLKPEEARIIKEKLCYIPDSKTDSKEESYTLPDGRNITLTEERHLATSPLFDPSLVEQFDTPGIHEMIFQSIFKCGMDLRRDFANNIILSGGNTLFPGMEQRLTEELEARVPSTMKVNVVAYPDRNVLVWRGGSLLGSLSTFYKNICVSKQAYEEFGASIVRTKCMNGL